MEEIQTNIGITNADKRNTKEKQNKETKTKTIDRYLHRFNPVSNISFLCNIN